MFNIFKKSKKEEEINNNAKACHELVHSSAWSDIEQMFIDRIMDIQSVLNVDDSSEQATIIDIKVRGLLARELKDILLDIKGKSERFEMNIEKKELIKSEDHVVRFDI